MKTLKDFEPDFFRGSGYAFSGLFWRLWITSSLKCRAAASFRSHLPVPGAGIREAEEFYDPFLDDPSDFMFERTSQSVRNP